MDDIFSGDAPPSSNLASSNLASSKALEAAQTSVGMRLLKERNALLDLSMRNRLLNTPLRTRNNRSIEIVDEKSAEVFRLLNEGRALSFLAGPTAEPAGNEDGGSQPLAADDPVDARGVAARHSDTRLQTRLTQEGLQKRLFDIWDDARTLESEQGVNILYLALGLVRWYESDDSDVARHAPLVLLPVQLERSSVADRFRLKGRDEPPSPNLTLQARMKADFGLVIEDFPDEDALDLDAYSAAVAETLAGKARWQVLPDAMVLGFFSFSKFLMYRDLDPDNWPKDSAIADHGLVSALLRDGFVAGEPLIAEDADIDEAIPSADQHHVVDADSSQAVAIAEAAAGRTLVVKGPPGTGKSQTITNIIAAAVAEGKTVLFVAEKMAALDVVHRRLKQAGLGPLALELHSNKISKRAVLEALKQTRDAAPLPERNDAGVIAQLETARSDLNAFAERLHQPLAPSGLTPHAILGRLIGWQAQDEPGRGLDLDAAETWTAEDLTRRRGLAEDIAKRLAALGPLPQHPWHGVEAEPLDPAARDSVARDIESALSAMAEAQAQASIASRLLGAPPPQDMAGFDRALAYLQVTPLPYNGDRAAFSDPAWQTLKPIEGLIDTGRRLSDLTRRARAVFNDSGQAADYTSIRSEVVTKGDGLFRFLDGHYKASVALLRSYVSGVLPKDQSERIRLIDLAIHRQQAAAAFVRAEDLGSAFGKTWQGTDSDWDCLDNLRRWRASHHGLPVDVWPRLAKLTDAEIAELDAARQSLYAAKTATQTALDALFATLKLDTNRAFAGEPSLEALIDRLGAWRTHLESLSAYIALAARGRELSALGAASVVQAVHDGHLHASSLLPAFEGAVSLALRDALFQSWPELAAFDGEGQDRRVEQFRHLDLARIAVAREQIAAAHSAARPKGNVDLGAGIGPLGVLNGEMAKKRSHLPIRVLLDKAGPAIQQLKPVFMMSPLSVAQFLKPGALDFDLLVMDEASQIEPVDALGAVARARQMVVVGDELQLPPTAFFKTLTDEDDEPDDDVTVQARDTESILDLCLAKGAPFRLLSWHYRSRHASLIAVSNREFYDSRLFIVPSPYDAVAGLGLKLNLLAGTTYDRGNTRTNPQEARIVAEAVMAHALASPEQSLGVATFSVAQRQAILLELERLRRQQPHLEAFFAADTAEPFFVKNLENIQGDERDVILISMGYGKTVEGQLAHNFGPLSAEGGERRLNVLISRAKLRCEVFSNFTGADIDLERSAARGVAALKTFLTFAETGRFDLAGEDEGAREAFEAEVARALRERGHEVREHIGASGFRIDLAVADPDKPGRFLLGIECDGAQYRTSRSARDRHRLRDSVLREHGWALHRIWSADWYHRPKEELRRLEAAISAARMAWRERGEIGVHPERNGESPVPVLVVEAPALAVAAEPTPTRNAYREARFAVDTSVEPHLMSLSSMADLVVRIVATEGPVHSDEVVARVRQLWGLQRAGGRIRQAVEAALGHATRIGELEGVPFISVPGQVPELRDRSAVASAGLRKSDMLPPSEIDLALTTTITDNFGATADELVIAVSRRFGFSVTSAQLRQAIVDRIAAMLDAGMVIKKGDLLTIEAD